MNNDHETDSPLFPVLKAKPDSARRKKRLNILLVEDDTSISELLVLMLEEMGHQVWTAFDGANAVELAWGQQPDMVLLDLRLPDMDGLEVARRLREEGYTGMIVAVTALAPEQLPPSRLSEAALDEHLIKPVSLQSLRDLFEDTEASL